MDAERLKQIEEIYHAALEISADKRQLFVENRCGADEVLCREVESLLSFEDSGDIFIDQSPASLAAEMLAEKKQQVDFTNKKVGYYKIIKLLGKGGMGAVYLAEDTKLDRKVALKILPSEFAEDSDRMNRFVREAKSASALNHPNIITIYEIGESDGTHFIATEFIDGVTLNEFLKAQPLKFGDILDVAIQAASALDEAHHAKIVHRDIKPDNIMVRRNGLVKILDFGIAKFSESPQSIGEEDATAIQKPSTSPGMIIGTANYMSPEQAKGEAVDARTDIFSFGVVLYEMLSGHLPFAGKTPMEIIGAVIHKEPLPLATEVAPEITKIIDRCLRKDKNERYQTVRDVLNDLKEIKLELDVQNKLERTIQPNSDEQKTQMLKVAATGDESNQTTTDEPRRDSITIKKSSFNKFAVGALLILLMAAIGLSYWFYSKNITKQINSIAVLPFENRSGDADSDYLSDGLAESLIYRLSQIPDLKVSPTSSVFRYKGKETDAKKVADELGVDSVMTGRITQRGDSLTISVELVDVRNNKSLWGEQYERKMSELLQTQREIAAEITNNLKLKLSGESEQRLAKKYTHNNEAYQLYLKGKYHYARRNKDDVLKAIEYFREAIKIDPNFALSYVGIADSFNSLVKNPDLTPKEAIPQAKAAAVKALEIDPMLAEAHAALADSIAIADWNWAEVEREFKKALELDPNVAYTHVSYGTSYLMPMGRTAEAVAELERAVELEPLSLINNAVLVSGYIYAQQNEKAVEQGRKTYDLDPNFRFGQQWLIQAYIADGNYTEAIALSEKVLQTSPFAQEIIASAGQAYAKANRRREAEQCLDKLRELGKTQYLRFYWTASIYAALGDKDKAFAELEKAFQERDWFLPRLKVNPIFDNLRDDARFKDLLKRMNLPD